MILAASAILVVLYGNIAWVYLRDLFLTYNDLNTSAAVVFGVATVLSILTLVANIVALQLDRRSK